MVECLEGDVLGPFDGCSSRQSQAKPQRVPLSHLRLKLAPDKSLLEHKSIAVYHFTLQILIICELLDRYKPRAINSMYMIE